MSRQIASTDHIRQLIQQGQPAAAMALLDQALLAAPQDPERRYLRGMLHAAAHRNLQALHDFDAALLMAPDLPPLLFNRGLVLFRIERMEEALQDFERLSQIDPSSTDTWINIGLIHARSGRAQAALENLQKADRQRPGDPVILRGIANALRETGQADAASLVHQRVLSFAPNDPAALTDYALCLLSLGRIQQADNIYQQVLMLDPTDQTALAGLYMTGKELGNDKLVDHLMDYGRLLGSDDVLANTMTNLDALRELALSHAGLIWEPAGRSTTFGRQSPMLDLSQDQELQRFEQLLVRTVESRMQALSAMAPLSAHPWMKAMPRRWRLQSWITVLEQGGHQAPHIHPAGWLSGVFYVDPGQPDTPAAGNLLFGHPQQGLPLHRPDTEHTVVPTSGRLVTFPSYFFHNTTAYQGPSPRISIAFDVIPLR